MEKHGTPNWLSNTLVAIAVILFIVCLIFFEEPVYATSFLWVDTVNGSDTSANPWQPNTPLRTYAAAIALGADGDTIGVKIKPGSAQLTPEEAFVIISSKPDIVRTHAKKEVIPCHGELPDVEREESKEAGIAIVRKWRWVIMQAANGQLFETCVAVDETVEDL